MTIVRIDLDQLSATYSKLGPRMVDALKRGAMRGAHHAVAILQQATSKKGVVNTGFYKRAWKAEKTGYGARVYNQAPYASIMEHGRRAGKRMPPKEPIVRWIQRRLGRSEQEARRLAFVFQRAIARKGITGRKVLADSIDALTDALKADVIAELDREMAKP